MPNPIPEITNEDKMAAIELLRLVMSMDTLATALKKRRFMYPDITIGEFCYELYENLYG